LLRVIASKRNQLQVHLIRCQQQLDRHIYAQVMACLDCVPFTVDRLVAVNSIHVLPLVKMAFSL